ncbi:pentapeptide repeat-containing protein [Lentzea rhizosphaerae]|uniref:Pentapeptide repeat-containing protein n=1 Tax=Lentzea rhizosphaerae TaxID=2041025 RepID=A0ABV8C7E0_9PSEU
MEADDFRGRLVPGADLRGVTFPPGCEQPEIDLHGADLRGADVSNVSWWDVGSINLSGADFRGATLGAPELDGANLRGADLSGHVLGRTQFQATSFAGADLTGADLSGVEIDGGDFDRAVLDGARLDGAVILSCTMRHASLVGASLVRANLRKAVLTSADLRGADLTDALLPLPGGRIDLATFGGVRFDSSTRWPESVHAQAVANSVAGPDGTHVINTPPAPPPPPVQKPRRVQKAAGRVVAFLLGAGVTVMAALTVTGDVVWSNGAGDPITNIFFRVLTGLLYGAVGLSMLGAGILGFPEGSHSRTRRRSGGGGFDGDVDGCGIDAD